MTTPELHELVRLLELALADETVAGQIVIGKKRAATDLVRARDAATDAIEIRR